MPRKTAKKIKKTLTKTISVTATETLAKNFIALLKKIPLQFGKDLAAAKQQTRKLVSALKKVKAQKKAVSTILVNKRNDVLTPAAKKRVAAGKKTYHALSANLATLTAQVEKSKQSEKMLSLNQSKFKAINKYITDLGQQAEKKPLNKAKATPKKRKKTMQQTAAFAPAATLLPEPAAITSTTEPVEFNS
jgi:hypothetical protein